MPKYKLLASICVFASAANIFGPVKAQMMPEYDTENDDYPSRPDSDYPGRPDPDYPDHLSRPDPYGMADGGHGRGIARKNEVVVGRKRFKLYEKKRLNFKRAKEFCKQKEGRLAEAKTVEEMRRLESLFMRARMIGMDVWVGADKKKWKKHSMKEVTHPGLNLDKAGMEKSGIKASLVGGGMKEMCPAMSLSTRNLGPVQCVMPLPFICEYDRNRPRTTRRPKGNSTTKSSKKKKDGRRKFPSKDEMKK